MSAIFAAILKCFSLGAIDFAEGILLSWSHALGSPSKKLTVKIFLLIATGRNSALAVKCPKFQTMTVKARPIETLLKLVTIWRSSDIFIAQINILFFTRVTLAICIHLSFTGFISVSCFLVYVCHAIITWQIKFLEQKIMMKTHKPLSFSMNVVRLSIKAEILQT